MQETKSAVLTYGCVKEDGKKKTMWTPTTTARDEDKELLYYRPVKHKRLLGFEII